MRTLAALSLTLAFIFSAYLHAQTKEDSWQYYSTPDNGFRVRLPGSLKRVKAFDAEHGVHSDPELDKEGVRSYVSAERDEESVRFGIVIFPKHVVGKYLTLMTKEKWQKGIAVLFFGDDDESQFLSKPKKVKNNGFGGTEYVFLNVDKANRGAADLYSRGRIFEHRGDFFLLIFVGKNGKDLFSKDTNEFFDSFEFLKKQSKIRRNESNLSNRQ
jgi:hypothetical protein